MVLPATVYRLAQATPEITSPRQLPENLQRVFHRTPLVVSPAHQIGKNGLEVVPRVMDCLEERFSVRGRGW